MRRSGVVARQPYAASGSSRVISRRISGGRSRTSKWRQTSLRIRLRSAGRSSLSEMMAASAVRAIKPPSGHRSRAASCRRGCGAGGLGSGCRFRTAADRRFWLGRASGDVSAFETAVVLLAAAVKLEAVAAVRACEVVSAALDAVTGNVVVAEASADTGQETRGAGAEDAP